MKLTLKLVLLKPLISSSGQRRKPEVEKLLERGELFKYDS
jgi:hypothetical protein